MIYPGYIRTEMNARVADRTRFMVDTVDLKWLNAIRQQTPVLVDILPSAPRSKRAVSVSRMFVIVGISKSNVLDYRSLLTELLESGLGRIGAAHAGHPDPIRRQRDSWTEGGQSASASLLGAQYRP